MHLLVRWAQKANCVRRWFCAQPFVLSILEFSEQFCGFIKFSLEDFCFCSIKIENTGMGGGCLFVFHITTCNIVREKKVKTALEYAQKIRVPLKNPLTLRVKLLHWQPKIGYCSQCRKPVLTKRGLKLARGLHFHNLQRAANTCILICSKNKICTKH